MAKKYKRLCGYIESTTAKTLYKNDKRYECCETKWADKIIYSISVYDSEGCCINFISTQDKDKANGFYRTH